MLLSRCSICQAPAWLQLPKLSKFTLGALSYADAARLTAKGWCCYCSFASLHELLKAFTPIVSCCCPQLVQGSPAEVVCPISSPVGFDCIRQSCSHCRGVLLCGTTCQRAQHAHLMRVANLVYCNNRLLPPFHKPAVDAADGCCCSVLARAETPLLASAVTIPLSVAMIPLQTTHGTLQAPHKICASTLPEC